MQALVWSRAGSSLLEMQDERTAVRLASHSAHQQKSIASNRMAKIKLWKGKYEEMRLLKDAYMNQSTEIEEIQRKIDEYEVLTEEMTEDYEATILSMCPRHIEKARVMNLTNKYGHQGWKPFVDKSAFEGAFPLYVGRSHMVAFLNERLCSGKTFLLLQFICICQISIS
jgi:hypothetical protein